MGATNSRAEKNEALCMCKERKRFIKVAIDSRYDLAASHVSYIQSLRNVGIALRRYAEAEVLVESSLSISDKTPSQTSYPSPSSPLNVAEVEVSDSPLHNESPFSTPAPSLSYMRSSGSGSVTVTVDAFGNKYLDDESNVVSPMPPPPPPPPPPELGASWDFFDPGEDSESFRFVVHGSEFRDCRDQWFQPGLDDHSVVSRGVEGCKQLVDGNVRQLEVVTAPGSADVDINLDVVGKGDVGRSYSKKEKKQMDENNVCTEREDPSEFITHRAKDFLSSIKDIEHRFIRASESGRDVSRLLEANKIKVGFSEAKGNYLL